MDNSSEGCSSCGLRWSRYELCSELEIERGVILSLFRYR